MKDLTPFLNLLAFHMKHRRNAERRESINIGDYDAYLEVQRLTARITYLASFIRTLS